MNKRQAKKKRKKEIAKTLVGVTVYKEKVEPRVIIYSEDMVEKIVKHQVFGEKTRREQ